MPHMIKPISVLTLLLGMSTSISMLCSMNTNFPIGTSWTCIPRLAHLLSTFNPNPLLLLAIPCLLVYLLCLAQPTLKSLLWPLQLTHCLLLHCLPLVLLTWAPRHNPDLLPPQSIPSWPQSPLLQPSPPRSYPSPSSLLQPNPLPPRVLPSAQSLLDPAYLMLLGPLCHPLLSQAVRALSSPLL